MGMSVFMQMLYVCVLCAVAVPMLRSAHQLRRPYRRGILQSRSHNCFIGSHLFTPSCCSECHMCVLYVSFGSKVRPTFGCVAMGSDLLFIVRSDCSYIRQGLNRLQVVPEVILLFTAKSTCGE